MNMPSSQVIALFNAARNARQARYAARERLKALVKPKPDYARRCAAQLPPGRRERFLERVKEIL